MPRAALIIVLWVSLGLVSLGLYFAYSMSLELKASENRLAGLEAEQAIEGVARYLTYFLGHLDRPGQYPDLTSYLHEEMVVEDARTWLIGRDPAAITTPTEPYFSLVDESSKINLNTATRSMLEALPRMTPALASAIIDWRDSDSEVSSGGAEDETYQRMNPPYRCKNGRFESVEELRLISGMDLDVLYGEDLNQNGILDPNENDGETSLPLDNKDGKLDPGLVEYVTVWSQESNLGTNGSQRVYIGDNNFVAGLGRLLGRTINGGLANRLRARGPFQSVLQFYFAAKDLNVMSATEFANIEDSISAFPTATNNIEGTINVNTASQAVLACIPGIGTQKAQAMVAYRGSHPDQLTSITWVAEVLLATDAQPEWRYLTTRSHRFTADIAAVGKHTRGYRRVRYVFDNTDTTPKVIYRRDLSQAGWALGRKVRETDFVSKGTP